MCLKTSIYEYSCFDYTVSDVHIEKEKKIEKRKKNFILDVR